MNSDRPLVVVSGTAHWASRRLAEHHIAANLTRYANVLFVDPPVSPWTLRQRPELAEQLHGGRLRELSPGLYLFAPVVLPGKDRPGMVRVTDMQVRRDIRQALSTIGGKLRATILTLPQRDLFDRGAAGQNVYWAKDDHQAGAHLYGLNAKRLSRSEARLVAAADTFLVCSDELAAAWRRRGAKPVVLPNGCDAQHFARAHDLPRPDDLDPNRTYAIYMGTLTERIDDRLVKAVADRGIDVLLVGAPRRTSTWSNLEELVAYPHVHLIGRRRFDELPAYLGASTVGLLPYRADAYNRGSFPLKLLEYLAAGLPVVSTDLPAVRWLDSPEVAVASSPSEFGQLVANELERSCVERSRACRATAAAHDWSQRADELARILGLRS